MGHAPPLIDFGKGEPVPFAGLVDELIGFTGEDAEFFDCVAEVAHTRRIVAEGTSADRQLAVYDRALAAGRPHEEALQAVVDHLIDETVAGCETAPDAARPADDSRRTQPLRMVDSKAGTP